MQQISVLCYVLLHLILGQYELYGIKNTSVVPQNEL